MTGRPKKKPTSFDVAQLAGVDRSAVSRAFSGQGRMADGTRKRILAAADQLGYRVNYLARGLQGSKSQLVGIVASRLDTPFRATQVRVIAATLLEQGYTPVLVAAERSDDLSGLMDRLLRYAVSGMIVTSDTPPSAIIDECAALSVPVVLINRAPDVQDADRVQIDVHQTGRLAHQLLRDSGGTRFAMLLPSSPTFSVTGRAKSFAESCERAGQTCLQIDVSSQDYDSGLQAATMLYDCADRPDAVFATTDLLALGLLDGMRHVHGLSVPEEIQVLGFDDIPQASWLGYQLSTMRQDAQQAARAAVDLMLSRLHEPDRDFETRLIEVTAHLRQTTRKCDLEN